jgi:hypothetical protein
MVARARRSMLAAHRTWPLVAAAPLTFALACAPPSSSTVGHAPGGAPSSAWTRPVPSASIAAAPSSAASSCDACSRYATPETVGAVREAAIDELSGMAASRLHQGLYWVHNDSGDLPRIFAIEPTGVLRAEVRFDVGAANDWEDIAVGPCDGEPCVFAGDIGDNHHLRTEVQIHRVAESKLPIDTRTPATVHARSTRATYPDGPHDAEAMFVDPSSGDVVIVTKVWSGTGVAYRLPTAKLDDAAPVMLERIGPLAGIGGVDPITAADAHPCASRVIVRTYRHIYEYAASPGLPLVTAFSSTPTVVPSPREYQSEAIAYRSDGRGWLTSSEGEHAPIWSAGCADGR